MLQKIQSYVKKFLEEKGQGIVEYALILGFVAIIAIFVLNNSGLKEDVKDNIRNADSVAKAMQSEFSSAAADANSGSSGGSSGGNGG